MDIITNRRVNPVMRTLCLTGPMGVGKTTVGQVVSIAMGMGHADLDELIEADHGRIRQIFAVHGEEYFRNLEHKYLVRNWPLYNVLSLGGGLNSHSIEPIRRMNLEVLSEHAVTMCLMPSLDLDESVDILAERLASEAAKRPVLQGDPRKIREVLVSRFELYKRNCDVAIYTGRHSVHEVSKAVACVYAGMFKIPL